VKSFCTPVIRRDGSVDSIQLVRGIDQQLDANAIRALRQWKFRPGAKQGAPVELEAIVQFRSVCRISVRVRICKS